MKARQVLSLLLLAVCSASGQETSLLPKLAPVPLFPALRAQASADGIPMDGIEPATGTNLLSPGDSLTALITLHQKRNRHTEWLVYIQVVPMTNPPMAKTEKPDVLYDSTGDRFVFSNSPVKFHLRTLGPYAEQSSFRGKRAGKDNSANALVNEAFLNLGLERGAAAIHRLNLAHATNFNFSITEQRPSGEEILSNQKLAATFDITPVEKRVLASWYPALMSYLNAVSDTPDLETIMWKVISLPSVWSIVRHVGVTPRIRMDFNHVGPFSLPSGWRVPDGSHIFALPLTVDLNAQPSLKATLFVTAPHPSLLACGGIIGFVGVNPHNDQDYLTLRVISTRWGKEGKVR